jgi:hypothetical protein
MTMLALRSEVRRLRAEIAAIPRSKRSEERIRTAKRVYRGAPAALARFDPADADAWLELERDIVLAGGADVNADDD